MSDSLALTLAGALAVVAAFGLWKRDVLQPNRAGALLYLAGAVGWGVALAAVWTAWASSGGDLCESDCEELVGSVDLDVPGLPHEAFLQQDWPDLNLTLDGGPGTATGAAPGP